MLCDSLFATIVKVTRNPAIVKYPITPRPALRSTVPATRHRLIGKGHDFTTASPECAVAGRSREVCFLAAPVRNQSRRRRLPLRRLIPRRIGIIAVAYQVMTHEELIRRLREAVRDHHAAHISTGSGDSEWPILHAACRQTKVSDAFSAIPTRGELTHFLIEADRQFKANSKHSEATPDVHARIRLKQPAAGIVE